MGKKQHQNQKNQQTKKSQFAEFEEEIVDFWEENHCFETSVKMRPEDKQYVFYDGPPFATGLPHYGHMLASTVKDSVPRFWTMRGYRVERRWGWDCHGLPIENIVEKEFGLNSRKDIEAYGIDKFNAACESKIFEYDAEWAKFVKRIGRWVDFEHSYKTMDNSYMESVWWAFKELYTKGFIYEGRRVSLFCPRCGTPLSNFEIAMDNSYKNVKDPSVIWKFPIVGDQNTSLLAWTTTPWSTPGTTGLSIGPDFDYVKVKVGNEYSIFAKARMDFVLQHLEKSEWKVVKEMKGADLVGTQYIPIIESYKELPEVKGNEHMYTVYPGDYVEVEEGTGIVTINGAYGEIDMEAAEKNGLPLIFDVDEEGKFNEKVGHYAGIYIKDAEAPLIADMDQSGHVWRTEPYEHSYPHCWRCDTPLYYYASPAWYIAIQKLKQDMLEQNKKIHWHPAHLKYGRFGVGIETAPDWNISRTRFWGTAIPVWNCTNAQCDGQEIIGAVEALSKKAGKDLSGLNLHRPYIDEITFPCANCNSEMKRIPEVFDCWVESGSMPFAEKHYPFENKKLFEKFYPAEFISEYIAQTRGWFYTLHVLSTALFGEPSFLNSVTTGTLRAEDGSKMSKSKKNYPEPSIMFNKYSVDAIRFFLLSCTIMDGEKVNFSERDVEEIQKKYINTFWNVFTFFHLFSQHHTGEITQVTDPSEVTHVLDRWILAKLHQTVKEIQEAYEAYDIRRTALPLQDIVQELSTWYLRRSRRRFKGDDAADRTMALRTLYTVLIHIVKIGAPVTPFITEKIYQEMKSDGDPLSVHHCDWPKVNEAFIDQQTLDDMYSVREAIEKVLAIRAESGIKVRQPIQSATIVGKELHRELQEVMKEELNVKAILFGDEWAIDTDLTEELKMEGALRELVRQTNALRKKAKLSIQDMIDLAVYTESDFMKRVLEKHGQEYQKSVLASSLRIVDSAQEHEIRIDKDLLSISF